MYTEISHRTPQMSTLIAPSITGRGAQRSGETQDLHVGTYLVVGVDQCIGHHDVLSSCGGEDNHLGNVIWCEGFHATILNMCAMHTFVSLEIRRTREVLAVERR